MITAGVKRLADGGEYPGEKNDGEEEVGDRAGRNHRRPLAKRFVMEAARAVARGHRVEAGVPGAGGIGVAKKLHVSAERDPTDFPARAKAVVPAVDLRPKADGKDLDPNGVGARNEVMTHLVNEDEYRQRHQKRQHDAREIRDKLHV